MSSTTRPSRALRMRGRSTESSRSEDAGWPIKALMIVAAIVAVRVRTSAEADV